MNVHRPHLLPKLRSEALRQSMQDMPCTLRIASMVPGTFCAHPSTVVGCHLPIWGRGVGTKASDLAVAAGCATCHDLLDGRSAHASWLVETYPAAFYERLLHGLTETHAMLLERGLLTVKDMEIV